MSIENNKSTANSPANERYITAVSAGTLYLVATPIGNLADITQRAIDVLKQVDIIAAEDTRHSQRLLSFLGIKSRMLAYHEHNEEQMTPRLYDELVAGKSIALISDAGTPLISDPGYRLVSYVHTNIDDSVQGDPVKVVPVPGACAAIAALSAAGLATDAFAFEGFPPSKQGARVNFLQPLAEQHRTMIFYVSCHKIINTLKDMSDIFGPNRRVTFARELTKTFETIKRTTLSELVDWVVSDENQRKGEIVLIVEGKEVVASDGKQLDFYISTLLAELPVKQCVKLVVKLTGENKNDIYKRALEIKEREAGKE